MGHIYSAMSRRHAENMLQPPQIESSPNSRPLSIMTTGTTATAQDKSGETWKVHVTEENCWEDLILTLGTYSYLNFSLAQRLSWGERSEAASRCEVALCV
ncbi:hypothetical protein DE146DRAFT_135560 [Phaeosphaeria sp. MPI-PUGE-AT-0046c]|nr:hypothetical protein DE146DRAFT_135560 [Phaeosphaeria sp. MPI-PUGE-AT-0046c]